MYEYAKLWVYKNECIFCSVGLTYSFERILGKIIPSSRVWDFPKNIWDYAVELKEAEGWEVFQVVNFDSETNIELYLKRGF